MTAAAAIIASQRVAGGPIALQARWTWDQAGWADNFTYGIGVTPTAARPTLAATFSHVDDASTAGLDPGDSQATNFVRSHNGAVTAGSYTRWSSAVRNVDSNFLAGHFLWAFASNGDGTALNALAGPYKIR